MDSPKSGNAEWKDLSYPELVDHIHWIRDPLTDEDIQVYYIDLIDSSLPGADVSDLIFWPDQWFKDDGKSNVDMSDEEVAHYLMAWTGKRLSGAETIDLPELPESKKTQPPPVIEL